MKALLVLALALLFPALLAAQPGVPRDVETALARIEHAFQMCNPAAIEDLLPMSTMMRLGDSLFLSASRIKSLDLLKTYFSDKDSVAFHFESPGTGRLVYSAGGKRQTVSVDVWLSRSRGEIELYALNISNYPSATVFMDIQALRR